MSRPLCGTAAVIAGLGTAIAAAGACLCVAAAAPAARASVSGASSAGICTARTDSAADRSLAERLSSGIAGALRGRVSSVGLDMDDPGAGISCQLDADQDYDSASIVKATILAALLRERMQDHEPLSAGEQQLATEMITASDNHAASYLWQDVGAYGFQHFLDLARMTETIPGPGSLWGVTQVTARDQVRLLRVLCSPNRVLDAGARAYELGLMANVESGQRWGVSAGAPPWMTVRLKNGWLPQPETGWHINSIGYLSGRHRGYFIAILSDESPSMDYGVETISGVAAVINRFLPSAPLPGVSRPVPPPRGRALLTRSRHRRSPAQLRPPGARTRRHPVAQLDLMDAGGLTVIGAGGIALISAVLMPGWVIVQRRRAARDAADASEAAG
ncbi:MAG: serine hydrolase [Streptosporangiaceae bacterium]|nr:serine hydrolase [Streptosporangiaceae bacterium]